MKNVLHMIHPMTIPLYLLGGGVYGVIRKRNQIENARVPKYNNMIYKSIRNTTPSISYVPLSAMEKSHIYIYWIWASMFTFPFLAFGDILHGFPKPLDYSVPYYDQIIHYISY